MSTIVIILLGYFIGSIPFALVIGKVFYKTDVRQFGSKNLGGGNTGRVLGKKAGLSVMTLDLLKVSFVVFLAVWFCPNPNAAVYGGLAAAIGHCYPIFAKFKGGKAVATMYGFLFGLFVFAGYSPLMFFLPLAVFLAVLYLTKIIALSSIVSAVAVTLYSLFSGGFTPVFYALVVFTVIIIIRHNKNIERMLKHQENKISWM
ncbi:MAG: glycerol-3-phosphate 1-O-acyltransferase PlsY [Oscillospiraceae bacterium]|nr:glycerol-3-phosphate 1-O-acyltransferase PlsY [Oscillospiraceae bacterium]